MKRLAVLITIVGPILSCMGSPQFHDSFQLDFSATAVCNAQEQNFSFKNSSDRPMTLEGAAMTIGTDPLGNFRLVSVTVGGQETASVGGSVTNIAIPAGATYSFKVNYAPKKISVTDHATLDIAFSDPPGVNQIELTGTAPQKSPSCPTISGPVASDLDGDVDVVVSRITALESKNKSAISSDEGTRCFKRATLHMHLDAANHQSVLSAFTDGTFVLAPPSGGRAATVIHKDTTVTMGSDVTGTYDPAKGELTTVDLSEANHATIHLEGEDLKADLPIVLTTGALDVAGDFIELAAALKELNGTAFSGNVEVTANSKKIHGTPIDSGRKVVLVGLSHPNVTGGRIASIASDVRMAVLIEAYIVDPLDPSKTTLPPDPCPPQP